MVRLIDELQRLGISHSDDERYLVVDLSAEFPYSNQDILQFGYSVSSESVEHGVVLFPGDNVLNHRNRRDKSLMTFTDAHGRKRCRCGSIIAFPNVLQGADGFYLNIWYRIGGENLVGFSVLCDVQMSDEKPCAGVKVAMDLEKPTFYIRPSNYIGNVPVYYGFRSKFCSGHTAPNWRIIEPDVCRVGFSSPERFFMIFDSRDMSVHLNAATFNGCRA